MEIIFYFIYSMEIVEFRDDKPLMRKLKRKRFDILSPNESRTVTYNQTYIVLNSIIKYKS